MIDDMEASFKKFSDEYLNFERIENPPCKRPDICAFLLLDKLVPKTGDMVTAAEHDEIFLETSCETLAEVATEDDILYLTRCGVRYDSELNSLAMFV